MRRKKKAMACPTGIMSDTRDALHSLCRDGADGFARGLAVTNRSQINPAPASVLLRAIITLAHQPSCPIMGLW